jgi:hypothetical protein
MGISVKGGAAVGIEVAWRRLHFSKVRPEDKMATNSQNGDTITLIPPVFSLIIMGVGVEE